MSIIDLMFHPNHIEREIDQGRLHNQWTTVLALLERLARTCDIGAAQLNVDAKLRTYYWTAMAELLLAHQHDYPGAMVCIRKAVELDCNATEWRIILVRILLEWTSQIILPGPDDNSRTMKSPPERKKTEFKTEDVLSEVLKVNTYLLSFVSHGERIMTRRLTFSL